MQINFFDDPLLTPRVREKVQVNQIGLFVYPDKRRVAVGLNLTPFLERPSLELNIRNEIGQIAATLSVIEANEPNFSLTMHLRETTPAAQYHLECIVYYAKSGEEKIVVDKQNATFTISQPGEQIIYQLR